MNKSEIAERYGREILNFLCAIDWSQSTPPWREKRISEIVERAIAESRGQWISVEEKLPEYGSVSMVYGYAEDSEKIPYQEIATYSYHGGWCVGLDRSIEYAVTHWQYLPEPPKGNENV